MQHRRLSLGIALSAAWLVSGCATSSAHRPAVPGTLGPEVELAVTPRVQFVNPRYLPRVRLRVIIKNANEALWCPEYLVDWGDGQESSYESDCEPFEKTSERDRRYVSESFRHDYRMRGALYITVRLRKAGQTVQKAVTKAEIR